MKKRTIAVIGTGRIACLLENDALRKKPCTHLGAILELSKTQKIDNQLLLCDIKPENLQKTASYIQKNAPDTEIQPFEKYKNLFKTGKLPDIVVIACDTYMHYPVLKHALENDVKKIVVEKPITSKPNEALKIEKLAKSKGVHIWVNYERRYHPKYIALRDEILANKKKSRPLYYRGWFSSSQKELYPNKSYEGVLLHDTTHLLDLTYFLFGSAKAKGFSPAVNKSNPRAAHKLFMAHSDGIEGEITTVCNMPYFHFELEILFSNKRIRVGNGFYYKEDCAKSPYYEGFHSLNEVENIENGFNTKEQNLMGNPFIRLYTNVYNNRCDSQFLKDACQNILTLTKA